MKKNLLLPEIYKKYSNTELYLKETKEEERKLKLSQCRKDIKSLIKTRVPRLFSQPYMPPRPRIIEKNL